MLEAFTNPTAVQVIRLLMSYCYVLPGLLCALAEFYQTLPTARSQGKPSAEPVRPLRAPPRIRVGIDIDHLTRHGGTKEVIGF